MPGTSGSNIVVNHGSKTVINLISPRIINHRSAFHVSILKFEVISLDSSGDILSDAPLKASEIAL